MTTSPDLGGLERQFDAPDVLVRIGADLQLKAAIPLRAILPHIVGHRFRRRLGDRTIEGIVVDEAAAEQRRDRKPGGLAEDVPAGDVDRRLHIVVAAERPIHDGVDAAKASRILAEERRCEDANAFRNTTWVRLHVAGAKGTDLAEAVDGPRRSTL